MRCAVVGDPIGHSLSPVLHRAAYEAIGLDWTYDAERVPAGSLAGYVGGLGPEWRGLSVTAPLKREAHDLARSVSPLASLAGVANTLVHGEDGSWWADNTDVPGAGAAVRERYDGPVTAATVLGGGATAVSTGLALAALGAGSIRLLVRDPARAEASAAAIRRHPSSPSVTLGSLTDDPVEGEVLVSTVPAEAQTAGVVGRCGDVPVVFEVTYHPWPTPLAAAALAAGRVLVSGQDLLVHQAALQLELFAGVPAAEAIVPMRVALAPR